MKTNLITPERHQAPLRPAAEDAGPRTRNPEEVSADSRWQLPWSRAGKLSGALAGWASGGLKSALLSVLFALFGLLSGSTASGAVSFTINEDVKTRFDVTLFWDSPLLQPRVTFGDSEQIIGLRAEGQTIAFDTWISHARYFATKAQSYFYNRMCISTDDYWSAGSWVWAASGYDQNGVCILPGGCSALPELPPFLTGLFITFSVADSTISDVVKMQEGGASTYGSDLGAVIFGKTFSAAPVPYLHGVPGNPHALRLVWGIDIAPTAPQVVCAAPATFNCAPAEGLSLQVQAAVTDLDGNPPIISEEEQSGTFTGSPTLTVTLKEGGTTLATQSAPPLSNGKLVTFAPHLFTPGVHELTIEVSGASGSSSCTTTITINADTVAPVISGVPAAITLPATSPAGAVVTFTAPTALDACDGAEPVTCTPSSGSTFPVGTTTVTCTASDSQGLPASASFTVTVTPPPCDTPVVTITGPASGSVYAAGAPVTFTASFTGASGPHTAEWIIDGTVVPGTVDENAKTVTATVPFAAAGVYQVQLNVANACGNTGSASTVGDMPAMVVIYDPRTGFVTGGGWINSPAGAPNWVGGETLTGKASFGFVSKYKKGMTVPTGETEFQFKAGNLKFNSTSYEWLVVSGARAQYKGAGTINGVAGYGFLLTAIDGQVSGGGGADKFRIKIWETATSAIVYDNQMGADDSALPITTLGGGSIVIHK